MDKLAQHLIISIKNPKDEWFEDNDERITEYDNGIFHHAVRAMMEWSGCERSVYTLSKMYDIIRTAFCNFLNTAQDVVTTMSDYEKFRAMFYYDSVLYPNLTRKPPFDREDIMVIECNAMLTALHNVRVVEKDRFGEYHYVNGFTD